MNKYVVGFNRPGFLPETEPSDPLEWDEAVEAMKVMLEEAKQGWLERPVHNDDDAIHLIARADQFTDAIKTLDERPHGEPWGEELPNGCVYWIEAAY